MKVALYTRVSTEEQRLGTSLGSQERELRRWAEFKEYQPVLYSDDGTSGTTDEREGLRLLIAHAEAKRFEVVAVTKLDRFFRNLRLLLDYIDRLDKLGITFVSTTESFDTSTSHGRFSLQMMGVIAEFERNRIIERTREGRYARYRQGKWAAGQPLYGYQYNRDTGKLEIREDKAQIVRHIYNKYVFDRLGVERIARKLNEDKVKPRQQARQWFAGAVRDVVSHPGYKGEHPLKIEIPAIIEPALWELAQQRRKDNHKLHRRNGSPWLLQGMIKCGLCGHGLACGWVHKVRRVYSCRGRLQGANPNSENKCSLKSIDAEWLENAVWEKITNALSNPTSLMKALDDYIAKLKVRSAELEEVIKPIDSQLSQISGKKAKLAEQWVSGALGQARIDQMKAELDAEETRLCAIRQEIDPAQIEELENTKVWLSFWQKSKRELDLRLSFIPDGAPDEAEQQNHQTSKVAAVLLGMADIDDTGLRDETGSPTTKRQLLDYLQLAVIPFSDRIELRAVLPINSIDFQDYNPG